jgi:hypothetical protein
MSAKRRVPPRTAYVPSASGMMEFEPVSIESAREALDEIDATMASMLSPEYWAKVRRKTQATDRALTGRSMKWLAELPEELRPVITMHRYARVINVIVDAWPNRKGRRGFPVDVERELSALCLFASALPR